MDTDRFARVVLWILAVAFLVVALEGLLVPDFLMDPVEVGLDSPSAYSEIRAGYSGCFGGLATGIWRDVPR